MSDQTQKSHWLDDPATPKRLWTVLIVILVILLVAELFVTHSHGGLMGATGFHAVYGLVIGLLSIVASKGWKKIFKRKDTYYDE
jgi:membrane-bound ClpP family serine protease